MYLKHKFGLSILTIDNSFSLNFILMNIPYS